MQFRKLEGPEWEQVIKEFEQVEKELLNKAKHDNHSINRIITSFMILAMILSFIFGWLMRGVW